MHKFTLVSLFLTVVHSSIAGSHAADTKKPTLSIQFLSKKEARDLIPREKIEPYFALMTPLDMNAKLTDPIEDKTGDDFLTAFKTRYQDAMREFDDEEKAAITACLKELEPTFTAHFPLLVKTPWRFIKKSDSLESGAHFTREDCIVLSEGYTRTAALWHKRMKEGTVKPAAFYMHISRLLLHEQMHVLQRLHPKRFAELYAEHWHFIRVADIKDHPWLEARRAVNPDGVDLGWILPVTENASDTPATLYYWTRLIYTKTEGHPRLFRDTAMIAVEMEKTRDGFKVRTDEDGKPVFQPLQTVTGLVSKFPFGGAYHPNEGAAGAMPWVIMTKYMPPTSNDPKDKARGERLAPFRVWARKNMQ